MHQNAKFRMDTDIFKEKEEEKKQLSDSQLGGVLFCFGKISPFKGTVSQPQIL